MVRDTAAFLRACKALGCQVLIRLKNNRKLYRRSARPTGKKDRPALDGPLLQPKRTETHQEADEIFSGILPSGKPVTVRAFKQLHFRQDREIEVSVVQVVREAATDSKRDPRISWFVLLDDELPLSQIAPVYQHRFSHEHGYWYLKQDLLWTHAHVRTPEQFERWTVVVSIVMNQLRVARDMGQACYSPRERRWQTLTPRHVRRMMPAILREVGTPARACQSRGKSPGRVAGFHPKPAARYPVVVKGHKSLRSLPLLTDESVWIIIFRAFSSRLNSSKKFGWDQFI